MVYLDETWCNAHDRKANPWIEKTQLVMEELSGDHNVLLCCTQVVKMVGSLVSTTLMHLPIVIKGCDWVFKSKKGSPDYHEETNATIFEEWLEQKLLPALHLL